MTPAKLDALADALAKRLVPLVAERIAERLAAQEDPPKEAELLDAAAVAELLGWQRSSVYSRAEELGAVRLGDGDKPRLRFPREHVEAFLTPAAAEPEPARRPRSVPREAPVDLLPIRGGSR